MGLNTSALCGAVGLEELRCSSCNLGDHSLCRSAVACQFAAAALSAQHQFGTCENLPFQHSRAYLQPAAAVLSVLRVPAGA
jgi:hypothetical protein